MRDMYDVLWSAGLLLLLAIAMFAGLFVARALRSRHSASNTTAPFTLQDLREMRASGQISEQEYESMRAGLLGQARRDFQPPAAESAPPGTPDENPDGD